MKAKIISLILFIALLLTSCDFFTAGKNESTHKDSDNNGICDGCGISVITELDLYSVNDLHGRFDDSDDQPGVDELTLYLKTKKLENPNTLILSAGDMWQGSSESNLTGGLIITEWMNEVGFTSMTLGNHEYDWGEEAIYKNEEIASFPFLAINVFDRDTNQRADYCESSVTVDLGELQVAIIGAVGDIYSSISADKSRDVYFKVGDELTELVKAESERLRSEGADLIIYSLHDGYDKSKYDGQTVSDGMISSYYDIELSDGGYVDLVFEGHTHRSYCITDTENVYHLQGGGENDGISYASISYNFANGRYSVTEADYIKSSEYSRLGSDSIVKELLQKYESETSKAYRLLGTNSKYRSDSELEALAAKLYYEFGIEHFSDRYDIMLGGGFLKTRNPYSLDAGEVIYADVQSIFPFDNDLVLCSVSGYNLKKRFLESNNSDYYVYTDKDMGLIDLNKTYYIITDSYTAYYAYNGLEIIEIYEEKIYTRDLLAAYIESGGLE